MMQNKKQANRVYGKSFLQWRRKELSCE